MKKQREKLYVLNCLIKARGSLTISLALFPCSYENGSCYFSHNIPSKRKVFLLLASSNILWNEINLNSTCWIRESSTRDMVSSKWNFNEAILAHGFILVLKKSLRSNVVLSYVYRLKVKVFCSLLCLLHTENPAEQQFQ